VEVEVAEPRAEGYVLPVFEAMECVSRTAQVLEVVVEEVVVPGLVAESAAAACISPEVPSQRRPEESTRNQE
jgi:hypothetical protein